MALVHEVPIVPGARISTLERLALLNPPATSNLPSSRSVVVCKLRAVMSDGPGDQVVGGISGPICSVVFVNVAENPPMRYTRPVGINVAVWE
jgi:hypothetical protein